MKKIIDCPMCDGKAELQSEKKKRTFRKEEFEITEFFYLCSKCREEFTTTDSDEVNTSQVYNQYREKYSIPFPEQLTKIKNEYGLNSTNFAKLLGFGVNQFSNYEKGEVPNQSNAMLLSLCIDPGEMLKIVEKKKELISEPQYNKVHKKLKKMIDDKKPFDIESYFFDDMIIPNRFTGYQLPSFEKFCNMILFFLGNAPFKTRLNKLLFYSDFAFYKYFGRSISGLEYAAIDKGPVPDDYEFIYGVLVQNDVISTELIMINNNEVDKFVSARDFNTEVFNEDELNVLKEVESIFRKKSTKELIEISHQEQGWAANVKGKNQISYQDYAFDLKAV